MKPTRQEIELLNYMKQFEHLLQSDEYELIKIKNGTLFFKGKNDEFKIVVSSDIEKAIKVRIKYGLNG